VIGETVCAVDVCICTRNPRRDVLRTALEALGRQTADKALFRVLIVDNGSTPPIAPSDCEPLARSGVTFRVVQEPRPGVPFARLRAIEETRAPIVIFVDDDNELADDYIATAVQIFADEPELGCVGPKLLPGPSVHLPAYLKPLLFFMAIRVDDAPYTTALTDAATSAVNHPPGAGMVARRQVVDLYLEFRDDLGQLSGYCEDLLVTLQARRVGLLCAYRPQLSLRHHLDPKRFQMRAMARSFIKQGRSEVALYRMLRRGMPWSSTHLVRLLFWRVFQVARRRYSIRSGILMLVRDLSTLVALLQS